MIILQLVLVSCSQFKDENTCDSVKISVQEVGCGSDTNISSGLNEMKISSSNKLGNTESFHDMSNGAQAKQSNLNQHPGSASAEICKKQTSDKCSMLRSQFSSYVVHGISEACQVGEKVKDHGTSLPKEDESYPANINEKTCQDACLSLETGDFPLKTDENAQYLSTTSSSDSVPTKPTQEMKKKIFKKKISSPDRRTLSSDTQRSDISLINSEKRQTIGVSIKFPLLQSSFRGDLAYSSNDHPNRIDSEQESYDSVDEKSCEIGGTKSVDYKEIHREFMQKIDKMITDIRRFSLYEYDRTIIYTYFIQSRNIFWYFNRKKLIDAIKIFEIGLFKLFESNSLKKNSFDANTFNKLTKELNCLAGILKKILDANKRFGKIYKIFARHLINLKRISKGLLNKKDSKFIESNMCFVVSSERIYTFKHMFLLEMKALKTDMDTVKSCTFDRTNHNFMRHNASYLINALFEWNQAFSDLTHSVLTESVYRATNQSLGKLFGYFQLWVSTYREIVNNNSELDQKIQYLKKTVFKTQEIVDHTDDTS